MLYDSSVCLYHQRTGPVYFLSFSRRIPCFVGRCKHSRCFRGVWVTGSTGEVTLAVSSPELEKVRGRVGVSVQAARR